jgi:hypothetical protein
MSKFCFGMPSVFCGDSNCCRECDSFEDCARATYANFSALPTDIVKRHVEKHRKLMEKLGLIQADDVKVAKKKEAENPVLSNTNQTFYDKGYLKLGYINPDLNETDAPEWFKVVAGYIRLNEKVKQDEIVRAVKLNLPDEKDPLAKAALALQLLAKNEIVKVTKTFVRWTVD